MATPGKPIDQKTRERIAKMREQGVSVRTVAKAMQVSLPTVQRIFKKRD